MARCRALLPRNRNPFYRIIYIMLTKHIQQVVLYDTVPQDLIGLVHC
jgi:hypothetical protein